MKKIFDRCKKYSTVLLFFLIILIGGAFRGCIAQRDIARLEAASGAKFAPFLVESAVMYSYINKAADDQDISGIDPTLPAMKNVKASEQMSLSLEYAGGWLLQLRRCFHKTEKDGEYEKSYEETAFLRTVFCWYIALSFGFIFLAMRFMKVPPLIAFFACLVEVFSAAALGRYTGQDLIKGAFAMPLLTAYLASAAAAVYCGSKNRRWALLFAFFAAAAAVASWDASQIIIGLLAACEIVRAIFTNTPSRKQRDLWIITYTALVLCSIFIPYNQQHGAFFSPVLQLLIPSAIAVNMLHARFTRLLRLLPPAIFAAWSIIAAYISPFSGNYGHFAELMLAKIKHGNILPADPGSLSFNVRYLWTPELHSATWKMTGMLFPGILMTLIGLYLVYIARNIYLRKNALYTLPERVFAWELTKWLILTATAFTLYSFMARFRDISVLFGVFAIALFCSMLVRKSPSRLWQYIILLILIGTVAAEWRNSRHLQRGYPQGLQQTAALIKHLRKYDLSGKVFLSDMQTSTLLKGYTDASILVQAKYELPEVRKLTEEFIMTFYQQKITDMVEFCNKYQVDHLLIHIPTITTSWKVPYSYCYVSNTRRLKKDSAAGMLGLGKGHKNFFELPLPPEIKNAAGYRLYKYISPEDILRARDLRIQALEAYYLGNLPRARRLIRRAYRANPGMNESYKTYMQIYRKLPPEIDLPKRKKAPEKAKND